MIGSKEIAELLGVKTVTVRKYAQALEAAGYIISRNEAGHRVYSEVDATAFRELQALCERSGITIENGAEVIAARHKRASETVSPSVVQVQNEISLQYEERYKEIIETLAKVNEKINDRLDEQKKEIMELKRIIIEDRNKKWWKVFSRSKANSPENDPEVIWKNKISRFR